MGDTRRADLAGTWYPGRAAECEREIAGFLRDTDTGTVPAGRPVGGIVPHAGWRFSGSIACNVIHRLCSETAPDAFVIFGMHLHPDAPAYIMRSGAWETPFGDLEIEETLAGALAEEFPFQVETADDYLGDNTIELQLPFVKHFSGDSKIVPIGVPPRVSSLDIGVSAVRTAEHLGLKVKVIGSTDLTHYGTNYGFAPEGSGRRAVEWVRNTNDRRAIDIMLAMNPDGLISEALSQQNACCSGAAATAIAAARELGAESADTLAYATSYDKHPDDSFVGYVGILFH